MLSSRGTLTCSVAVWAKDQHCNSHQQYVSALCWTSCQGCRREHGSAIPRIYSATAPTSCPGGRRNYHSLHFFRVLHTVKFRSRGPKRPAGSTRGAAVEPPFQKSFINGGSAQQGICCWVSAVHAASAGDDGAERGKRFVQSDFGIFGFWRSRARACSPVWSPCPGSAHARGLQSGSAISGFHTTGKPVPTSELPCNEKYPPEW